MHAAVDLVVQSPALEIRNNHCWVEVVVVM